MPLILAIEPDRQQASKLAALAPVPLKAEFIVADSTERGFAALGGRVPDLILTSLLLSSKDEAALADRLRDLDGSGARVQTLVIPVLSTLSRRSAARGGIFDKLRRPTKRNSTPDGCDPSIFAEQIAEYLKGAEAERDLAVDAPTDESEDTSAFEDPASDFLVDPPRPLDVRPTSDDVVGPAAAASGPSMPREVVLDRGEFAARRPDVPDLMVQELETPSSSEPASYDYESPVWTADRNSQIEPIPAPAPPAEPPSSESETHASNLDEDIAAFLEALPKFDIRSEPADPPAVSASVAPQVQSTTSRNASTERPRRKKDQTQSVPDEWRFFDPQRCGFAALLAKLDDLAAANE